MELQFAMKSEARGEGLLLKVARTLGMPGMSNASIDGGDTHAKLFTQFRRVRTEMAMDKFRREMQHAGFNPVPNLKDQDNPTARTFYRSADHVYIVITSTPKFYSVELLHRAAAI